MDSIPPGVSNRDVGRGSRFYSLSCETYSGTSQYLIPAWFKGEEFLFAVVRDVQRNRVYIKRKGGNCFYSLSCETYSGTGG